MVFYDERKWRRYIVRGALALVFVAYFFSGWLVLDRIHSAPTPGQPVTPPQQYDGTAIALTFDDGPDPMYTPLILDILKEKQAHATFFFVGKQMLDHQEIVRRTHNEGHEIGNHSFSHSNEVHKHQRRIHYELQTTNEIIKDITGRPARFYRSPFLMDFEGATDEFLNPDNYADGHPVTQIDELGYVSVSAYIDPQDWDIKHGGELLHRVLERVKNGNVLLLHDGGPQQEATVEALPFIIDELRAHGFSIVRLSHLAGLPPNDSLAAAPNSFFGASLLSNTYRWLQDLFIITFIFILIVSIGRLLGVLFLRFFPAPGKPVCYQGGVSVLVPAFNEEANVAGTLRSIAASTHETIEILLINDGSSDHTKEIAEALRSTLSRPVRYLYQHNGGKAKALNLGLAHARYDVIVAVDGDTIVHPDAISYLASHFLDPQVGAVAGKVVAVHDRSWLGYFQDMEYIVSQNVEKAAFNTLMGSITVIPGAIGAWRRAAVVTAGGYSADTSVEDQDLTLAMHALGERVVYDNRALAYTEVPTTIRNFFKQRFRWMYGTLQCLWKYKFYTGSVRRLPLGLIILPYGILFSVITPLLMPLIDLLLAYSLTSGSWSALGYGAAVFFLIDLSYHVIGFIGERRKFRLLPLVPVQRIFYRLIMSYLIYKSLLVAFEGHRVDWAAQLRAGAAAALFDQRLRTS